MSSEPKLPSLDGIRALCILLVIGAHATFHSVGFPVAWTRWVGYVVNAELGVRAFFVLSGFLISYLLEREQARTGRIALRAFWGRRLLRIAPVCYVYVAVLAALDLTTRADVGACGYFTSLAFLRDVDVCDGWLYAHLWSLSVEEQFYLLWPLVLVFAPRRARGVVAAALIAAAPLCRWWFHHTGARYALGFSFPASMDALMLGCVAGLAFAGRRDLVTRIVEWRPRLGRALALAAIAVTWVLSGRVRFAPLTVSLGASLQGAAIAYLIPSYVLVQRGVGFRLLNLRPVRYLGTLSFSLYVWQQLFMVLPGSYGATDPWFLRFPFSLAAAALTAAASYHLLERPLLRRRARLRPATIVDPARSPLAEAA